jgi:hypothetical protein
MKLQKSKNFNENYAARIVKLKNVRKHSNADKLQVVSIYGNNVITGLDAKDGDIYVYFPVESQINKSLISYINGFEDKERNRDTTVKSFFSDKARVRVLKLRGEKSEGFILKFNEFADWLKESGKDTTYSDSLLDIDFDTVDGKDICNKYVIRVPQAQEKLTKAQKANNKVKRFDRLIPEQFRFHISTSHLKKNVHVVKPNDVIKISVKLHGTSCIVSNILCNRKLAWYEKILDKCGIPIVKQEYDIVYASRTVVKNRYINPSQSDGFYGKDGDIWKTVFEEVKDKVPKSYTLYSEIVGFLPTGAAIQRNYDYGCLPNQHKNFIYRITQTNPDGKVTELSWLQIKDFCHNYGLQHVPQLYFGYAKDLFPELKLDEHWNENFLEKLTEKYLEKQCDLCINPVISEGIVLRRENLYEFDVYKHKSFGFLAHERDLLDAGETNIEDNTEEDA